MDLTPVEYRLLLTLYKGHGKVYSRNHIWVVSGRTVDTHIKNLRHKLREVNVGQDVICSVYGVGFKFELPE